MTRFDYQSDRHCAKTHDGILYGYFGLITSQIDTAPKHALARLDDDESLITSQIDTAPKLAISRLYPAIRLITSQIDTAPKPIGLWLGLSIV